VHRVAFAERGQREPETGASDESLQQRAAANGKDGCVTHGVLLASERPVRTEVS
jgi:hypothetical protein